MPKRISNNSLESLVAQWENDGSLLEPGQLQRRMEVLDRLDAYFPGEEPGAGPESANSRLQERARDIAGRLEAVNTELCASMRSEIRQGRCPAFLMKRMQEGTSDGEPFRRARGMGYDYLDELISGVFQFAPPKEQLAHPGPNGVMYQPTPARHIFSLIVLAHVSANDVLIDLGSGLGHVALLVSACTGARAIGIEIEPGYVAPARRCAESLNLGRVSFLERDARDADLSHGTVFYLYTPFTGATLRTVMDSLRKQAAIRPIKVCAFGPITPTVAQESWLQAGMIAAADQITVFESGI